MNKGPDTSGLRQPPQPHQQPESGEFRREVPDVSLVFNPDERSLVLPSLPSGRQQLQHSLHRSRSVPGRISDPALPPPPSSHYRTPPPRISPAVDHLRPSPATTETRPSPVGLQPRPSPVGVQPRPSPVAAQPRPSPVAAHSRPSPVAAHPRPSPVAAQPRPSPLTRSADARLTDVSISYEDGREVSRPADFVPERSCCGAELRAVLRLVAENGRQLAELRAQLRQLASRGTPPPVRRAPLLRDTQSQTDDGPVRPTTVAAGVNTSCSLSSPSRRDVGTDPAPPPEPAPAPAPLPTAGRPAELTGSGGRENTAQLQQRRVQEWVAGAGWGTCDEPDPELTLRGVQLPPIAEQPPSPEASVHVEMHEYQPSQDGSVASSVGEEDTDLERAKPDKTFFQNVMGQVNRILDGAGRGEPVRPARPEQQQQRQQRRPPDTGDLPPEEEGEEKESDPVRRATLQQLRAAGVSLAPSHRDDGSVLDYSCVPRAAPRPAVTVPCSSDLSLEINTLAMKYVDSRQVLQRVGAAVGRPSSHPLEARLLDKENRAPAPGRPTDMTMYGISDSNMSFSTRKYMERFNLQS